MNKGRHRKQSVNVEDLIAVTIGAIFGLIGFSGIMSISCHQAGGDGFIGGQCVTIDQEVSLWP